MCIHLEAYSYRHSNKPQALLCTDLDADPEEILSWFVMRWQLEVTFQEVRRPKRDLKRKGSGWSWQYGALHRRSWGSSHWSLCLRIAEWCRQRAPFGVKWLGTTRLIRPLPMRLGWCARSCGLRRRLFTGRLRRATRKKFHAPLWND